jgi:hypothetical protein
MILKKGKDRKTEKDRRKGARKEGKEDVRRKG